MTLSGRAGVVEEGVEGERAEGFRGRSAAARARPLRCDSRIKVMRYMYPTFTVQPFFFPFRPRAH